MTKLLKRVGAALLLVPLIVMGLVGAALVTLAAGAAGLLFGTRADDDDAAA